MPENNGDSLQKDLEKELEKCRDPEFLKQYFKEHLCIEKDNTLLACQNLPQATQSGVSTFPQQMNQFTLATAVLPNVVPTLLMNQLQQETAILNAVSNNVSARKRVKKI